MEIVDERIESKSIKDKIFSFDFVKRLKGIKNIRIIAIVFIIAIALIIYSSVSANPSDTAPTSMSDDEIRLSSILSSLDGVGEVESMISMRDGEIVGVLVIAEGGENPLTRLRIIDASASALGVDKSIVSVFSKN